MTWKNLPVSPDRSHHVVEGDPAYSERFDEVLAFHQPGLAAVRRHDEAWHITPVGQPAYPRHFLRTFGFYDGLAAVISKDGWHHVGIGGEDIYPKRYAWCGNFQEGRCPVRRFDDVFFHIDCEGNSAYPDLWWYAGDFRDGIAVVQAADGRSTHIDRRGTCCMDGGIVTWMSFTRFRPTRDRADGRTSTAPEHRLPATFRHGRALLQWPRQVEGFDGALEVIDEAGATIVELRPAQRSEFAALSADLAGFWRTQAIAAAVSLGLFEALPCSEEEVAERCHLHPDGARRILRALGELNLAAHLGSTWELTARGMMLCAEHPLTLADAAREYAGPLSQMWEHLTDALRADSGWAAPDIFGLVAKDEQRREGHHRMLRSYARHDYPLVPAALRLRGDERVADVGGGLGVLGRFILDTYPAASVTVLDRPEVIEQATPEAGQRSGLHWRTAYLFSPWPITADAVVLARVLHDWDDEAAIRILERARDALVPGGRVFILEMVMEEDGVAGSLCDIHLLVVAGGRERTAAEYEKLLAAANFALVEIRAITALTSVLIAVGR